MLANSQAKIHRNTHRGTLSSFYTMTCVIQAQFGIVDSDDGRSSAVGRDILKNGGNAVDAAVAVALCLGVLNQGSSGLGGGSFMLVRMNDGRVKGYDMRETAPSFAHEAFYRDHPEMMGKGPMSVTVPGELKGLRKAWEDFGSNKNIKWSDLVKPAIRFAKEGFTISPYLHYQMKIVEKDISSDPGMCDIYMRNGKLLNPGDICKNPKLAETLEAIAANGSDEFYKGDVGDNLIDDIRKAGGKMTRNDLKTYDLVERVPITKKLFGLDFLTMPPPASGGAGIILMSNFITDYKSPIDKEYIWQHRFIESCKHMFAVRTHLGDPKFDDITEVLKDMLSDSFATKLRKDTSDEHTLPPNRYGGKWHIENSQSEVIYDHGTSHMSIVDRHGNAVALTSSVNWHFGSRFLSPSTGILLNNTMDDFILPKVVPPPTKKVANRIQPHKRPLSSMAPTIILKDGKLKAVVGSSGGFRIIAGTTQVLLNHYARGMDILTSIMQPRVFHQLLDENQKEGKLEYEDWYTAKGYHFVVEKREQDYLENKGNSLKALRENNMCQFIEVPIPFPNNQSVAASNNAAANKEKFMTGASDPRKGSYPAGY